jgi:hypothetical protein
MFLELNFQKAFDQVGFKYLSAALKAIGLGGKFQQLVQGLVSNAEAWIHINGLFSEPIEIQRGVRQGDPLAPILFAIATHPLLAYLDKGLKTGLIDGVPISEELTVAHRFFADDVGIFIPATEIAFQKVRDAIETYKIASGAKLNLQKTIVVV